MKRFTLGLLAAFCCLMGHATVSSVDDLVGTYTASANGWEGISNYNDWTALSSGHEVTISKNTDGTIAINNLLNFSQTLTGTVDVKAKTITIAPSSPYYYYYTFADSTDVTKSVVGKIADDGVISFTNFNVWYGDYTYFYTGATVSLTKEAATEEWIVEGTITYTDDSKNGAAYYTGKTTLTKYIGSDSYDYIMKFDGPNANPSELKFKVYADLDSIGITNGEQHTGYAGAYFYYVHADNYYIWLDTTKGYTSLTGDKTKGELKIYCYSSASRTSKSTVDGYMYFTWDTTSSIAAPTAAKVDKTGPIYDLAGRKVSHPSTGIYIQNGKKFVVK